MKQQTSAFHRAARAAVQKLIQREAEPRVEGCSFIWAYQPRRPDKALPTQATKKE